MGDLEATLAAIAGKVKSLSAPGGEIGEENTKAALIDPVLVALGWDVHDLDEIRREFKYKGKGNPVDYAFFIGGTAKMFLEAKALGANLRDHKWRAQVVNYANTAGVEWCVLTDGNTWQVYKSNAPGDLDRKLFMETWLHSVEGKAPPFDRSEVLALLAKDTLAAATIEHRWKVEHVNRTAERALLGMIEKKDPSLVRLLGKRTELTKGDIQAWLGRAAMTVETSPDVAPPPEPPVKPPKVKPKKKRKPPLVPGLPLQKDIEVPLLRAVIKRGGEVNVRQQGDAIDEQLASQFNLTREQRSTTLTGSKETVWSNRVRWTRLRLVKKGDFDGSRFGIWAVTDEGRARAEQGE